MADSQTQPSTEPQLCKGSCGFYGSPDTNGFCSVCFKAHRSSLAQASEPAAAAPAAATLAAPQPQPAAQPAAEAAAAPPAVTPVAAVEVPPAAPAAAAEPSQPADDKPAQENRGRCFCCRKKVGLLGFECRCGYVFCSGHRHAADHACTFDYASFDKANLAKANNKVVAAKVEKL